MGGAIPKQVALSAMGKQEEKAMKSKRVSSTLHGLYTSLCLEAPALLAF